MDANEVFQEFMRLSSKDIGFLQYHLALNAVLEWFGRTIKGTQRICSYYKYDFQQFKFVSNSVRSCDPIESKPSHFQTKQIPDTELKKSILNLYKKSSDDFITPIQDNRKSPILPPLTQGRIFRSMTDSDYDDDDFIELGLSGIQEAITPPPIKSKLSEPLEKKSKHEEDVKTDNNDESISFPKFSDTNYFSFDDHQVSKLTSHKKDDLNKKDIKCELTEEMNIGHSSSNTDDDDDINNKLLNTESDYTDLMYLEVLGNLEMLNKSKHGGINKYDKELFKSPSPTMSDGNQNIRLKISYRINKIDNQIQFALIIYEQIQTNLLVKRNLMKEFEAVEDIEDLKIDLKRKIPPKKNLRI